MPLPGRGFDRLQQVLRLVCRERSVMLEADPATVVPDQVAFGERPGYFEVVEHARNRGRVEKDAVRVERDRHFACEHLLSDPFGEA